MARRRLGWLAIAVLASGCDRGATTPAPVPPPATPAPAARAAADAGTIGSRPATAAGVDASTADDCRAADEITAEHAARLPSSAEAERAVGAQAVAIRDALVRGDFAAVAGHVGDGRGICLAASKGARCRWMSAAELRRCATSDRREAWEVDSGSDEEVRLGCRDAFRTIFLRHPGLASARPTYNCLRDRPDNNSASLVDPAVPGEIYVELFADDADAPGDGHGWRSLWLVFARDGERHRLAGLTSHYWGI